MRTTQDDGRENEQIKIFGLKALGGRSNKYIPDAELVINHKKYLIELKTYDKDKQLISTARNVTMRKISEWRKVVWLFSEYGKTKDGFYLTGEHYLCFPEDLEPWFQIQETKLLEGTRFYGGLVEWQELKALAKSNGFCSNKLQRLENTLVSRAGLNDPRISAKTIANRKLNAQDPKGSLRTEIKKSPSYTSDSDVAVQGQLFK